MGQGDWLRCVAAVVLIGPSAAALVWVAVAAWRSNGKDEI